jgi:peptidoglycan hydrolase-like protein with peptidoglycan-binding domain
MSVKLSMVLMIIAFAATGPAFADPLVQIIQQDLVTLGYDPGTTDGEMGTKTIVAISKFQAEHDMEVTGEATPQLAGIIKAAINKPDQVPSGASAAPTAAPAVASNAQQDDAALQAAQQACLQEKQEAAQAAKKKKRGFGRLLSAVSRTGSLIGGSSTANQIARTAGDIYAVNATASDLEAAAEDLGLTEDDLEACRNP